MNDRSIAPVAIAVAAITIALAQTVIAAIHVIQIQFLQRGEHGHDNRRDSSADDSCEVLSFGITYFASGVSLAEPTMNAPAHK